MAVDKQNGTVGSNNGKKSDVYWIRTTGCKSYETIGIWNTRITRYWVGQRDDGYSAVGNGICT